MGLFDGYKLKRQLEVRHLELEIVRMEAEAKMVAAVEARYAVVKDPDEGMWLKLSGMGPDGMGPLTQGYDHNVMLDQAWRNFHMNPYAKTIIRGLAKFILGKGPNIRPKSKNRMVQEAWNDFVRENKWGLREKEMVIRTFRDGEVFLRFLENRETGILKIRFVRANFIKTPTTGFTPKPNQTNGVETDPDDIEVVVSYYYCTSQGTLKEQIPAADIMHIKIQADSDMKRGISFLLTVMPWIKKYEDWLEDRIALNKARSAIALVRTVEGASTTVESIRDAYKSQHQGTDKNKQQSLPRATVLTASKGITYSMLSPNIHAADVAADGRSILLAIAAGCGFPEMMLTADYSNANYSSSMVAQNPFVREIEDWQDFYEEHYSQLFARVIRHRKDFGDKKIPDGESEECTVEWPPLILANIMQNNSARDIQFRNKVLSRKTWQQKEGLDPDVEELNLTDEQGKEIYKQPFNLPVAPVNQFGSFIEDYEVDEEEEIISERRQDIKYEDDEE